LKQKLPDLQGVAGTVAKEPERIEIAAQADKEDAPPRKAMRKKKSVSKKKSVPKKAVRRKSGKI
jgi:hypothetical protein